MNPRTPPVRWPAFLLGVVVAATSLAAPNSTPGRPPAMVLSAPLPAPAAALAAIDERPAVQAALAGIPAAEARARALRAGPHETVLGGVWQERRIDGEGGYDEWEASVSRGIRWPHKAGIDRELANLQAEWAHDSVADARHEEARNLLAVWFAWLRAAADADHDAEWSQWLQRTRESVQRQVAAGEVSAMTLELAEAEAGKALARALRSRQVERQARHALAIAYPGLPLPAVPPEVAAPALNDAELDVWREVIVDHNHELQLARLASERAELEARRAAAERWPDPTIGVRVLSERTGAERAVGVVVSMPIPGTQRSSAAVIARAEARAAASRLEATRRALEETAAADVARVRGTFAAWQALQPAAESARQHLRRAQRAHELGESSLAEWLLSMGSTAETLQAERLGRLEAHEAIARLYIDGHELWAVHAGDAP